MSTKQEILDYRDLEGDLWNALNMADIACDQAGAAGNNPTQDEIRRLTFAIYHTRDLLEALKEKWNEVHASAVAAGVDGLRTAA